jgi:hypothetical protein
VTHPRTNTKSVAARIESFAGFVNNDPGYDPSPPFDPFEDIPTLPRKRKRRFSLTRAVRQARKLGVNSVTLPDGARLDFGGDPCLGLANAQFSERQLGSRTAHGNGTDRGLTPPARLGLLSSLSRWDSPGRAARGSVDPRKMACRPAVRGRIENRFKAIVSR